MKIRMFFKNAGKGILAPLKWILKIIKQFPGLLGEKPILTAAIVFIIIGFIVFRITIVSKQEGKTFISNIIAEGYGVVFDIFVFGILIAFFNLLGERRRDIKRWKEEIDDFRHWESEEAKFRIVGIIKRLNKAGVNNIDLTFCYLQKSVLEGTNLANAIFWKTNLKEAFLGNAILNGADLDEANLEGAHFLSYNIGRYIRIEDPEGPKLLGASFWRANLKGADLKKANLKNADLDKANLEDACLERANLKGAFLDRTNLAMANLKEANLGEAFLFKANLEGTNLEEASLEKAYLEGAILAGANLKETNLTGAQLMGADLRKVAYLSLDQLSKVKSLFGAELDPELKAQVKKKFPHLLEYPNEDK